MMVANGQFVADMLAASAGGIAALTVHRMLERRPECVQRFQPNASTRWRESFVSRLGYLSAALSTGCPKVFAEQAAWAKAAHSARGGPEAAEDLRVGLVCLREVVVEEFSGEPGKLVGSYIDEALEEMERAPVEPPTPLAAAAPHGRLAAEYLLAVHDGDRRKASRLLLDAAVGAGGRAPVPVPEIYAHVLGPVQAELGRMWQLNESTVAEEHFATATTQMVISRLSALLERKPENGKVAIGAAVEGNAHDIGVRMLGDLLEAEGWRVLHLGPSVPAADLADAVVGFRADLVALSAGLGSQLPTLGDAVRRIKGAPAPVEAAKVMVGGGALAADATTPDGVPLWKSLGADGFAADLASGIAEARRLCGLE